MLLARLFFAAVARRGLITGIRGLISSPRLRFSSLEIFAQRQLQPILPGILFRGPAGLALEFVLFIRHRRKLIRMCIASNDITGRLEVMSRPSGIYSDEQIRNPPQLTQRTAAVGRSR